MSQQRSESMLVCEHNDPAISLIGYYYIVVVSQSGDDDDQLEVGVPNICA